MRLLAAGVTVARTDNNLVRYHGKLMIVDHRQLFLLAFNFTYLDIEHSRSFGVITTNRKHVQEAIKLFEADTQRQPYTAGSATFIVSPLNARKRLSAFVMGAKKELLIYNPEISDRDLIQLLEERASAGVVVQIIGRLGVDSATLEARLCAGCVCIRAALYGMAAMHLSAARVCGHWSSTRGARSESSWVRPR